MKEMKFKSYDCVVKKTKYMNNDNLALVLLDKENGEMIAHITVNGYDKFPHNIAIVKDYSENEGMLAAITEAGLVEKVLGRLPLGYTTAPVVKFNLDGVEEL